ncbi:peptidylprolyl isomerase fpr3 [Collariella sp. IMI 366227]|nr:peptidylprolyl isomerase fpr3 [Collariella sp. IMI 366227]
MSPLLPVAVYGLEVPTGEVLVPAEIEFPATIRITMAAIDPTAAPETDSQGNVPSVPRSTLKIYKANVDDDDEDEDYLEGLLGGADDEDESDEDEEEANGGPSDPAKSKKARREAAIRKLLAATQEDSDDEMEDAGAKKGKGKGKASEDEESDEEDEDDEDINMEEYVVCTLDTERFYQQPIDITVGEGEKIFFSVKGTHPIYLTGNYVVPQDEEESDEDDEDDDDYDLPPGMELGEDDSDDMSDELDDIDGAERIKEIDTDEEEAPKLVSTKKGKKRAAEEEVEGLDEMMAKDEKKLSKKQQKKLKNNQGEPVVAEVKAKESPAAKGDKKVQFAKNLEQGPTGPAKDKVEAKADKPKAVGVKVVQGVTIDDRKVGNGRTTKNGDRVGMRYIGKLQNGKVFDSNKKGAPFSFKLGKGEVIKGWDIGIAGMSVGGERRLTIPAHLAYGSRSMPGIPANSTLIFDVKLLEIK